MTDEALFDEAMKLPPEKRAELASALIRSLDGEPDEDVEATWAREIERRVKAVEDGSAELEDWETVRARTLARLRGR